MHPAAIGYGGCDAPLTPMSGVSPRLPTPVLTPLLFPLLTPAFHRNLLIQQDWSIEQEVEPEKGTGRQDNNSNRKSASALMLLRLLWVLLPRHQKWPRGSGCVQPSDHA